MNKYQKFGGKKKRKSGPSLPRSIVQESDDVAGGDADVVDARYADRIDSVPKFASQIRQRKQLRKEKRMRKSQHQERHNATKQELLKQQQKKQQQKQRQQQLQQRAASSNSQTESVNKTSLFVTIYSMLIYIE